MAPNHEPIAVVVGLPGKNEAGEPQEGQRGAIPMVGFGSATLKEQPCIDACGAALRAGYRHIDTALLYGNQVEVGTALKIAEAEGVCSRQDVWVTSKVAFFPANSEGVWMHNANNEKGGEAASIDLCLEQLDLPSVDLMLIHNPAASVGELPCHPTES